MITNLLITALVLTNGVAAGSQELELKPIRGSVTVVCDYCKAFANYRKQVEEVGPLLVYIKPPSGKCECKLVDIGIEAYQVVPWVEPKKGALK